MQFFKAIFQERFGSILAPYLTIKRVEHHCFICERRCIFYHLIVCFTKGKLHMLNMVIRQQKRRRFCTAASFFCLSKRSSAKRQVIRNSITNVRKCPKKVLRLHSDNSAFGLFSIHLQLCLQPNFFCPFRVHFQPHFLQFGGQKFLNYWVQRAFERKKSRKSFPPHLEKNWGRIDKVPKRLETFCSCEQKSSYCPKLDTNPCIISTVKIPCIVQLFCDLGDFVHKTKPSTTQKVLNTCNKTLAKLKIVDKCCQENLSEKTAFCNLVHKSPD